MERNVSLKPNARPTLALRSLLALVVLFSLAASCSGDDGGSPSKKPQAPDDANQWAVHVYIGEPGAWTRVDLGPVPEVSFPAEPVAGAGCHPTVR